MKKYALEVDAKYEKSYEARKGASICHYIFDENRGLIGVFSGRRTAMTWKKKYAPADVVVSDVVFVVDLEKL